MTFAQLPSGAICLMPFGACLRDFSEGFQVGLLVEAKANGFPTSWVPGLHGSRKGFQVA